LGLVVGLQYYSSKTNSIGSRNILIFVFIDEIDMLKSLIYLTINQTLVYLTVTLFVKNFSLSEASILSQFVSGLAFDYYQSYFDSVSFNCTLAFYSY
jgi:hypothetical protein